MSLRSPSFLLIALVWGISGCGQKKPKVPETQKNPGTQSPTSGGDPSVPEFKPDVVGGEPTATDPATTQPESENPADTGETPETPGEPGTGESTDPATTPQTQGTGIDPTTNTSTPGLGSNPLGTLISLIQNPKQGMQTLLSSLISTLTGQSSGGGTSSLISGLLGSGTTDTTTQPAPTDTISGGTPTGEQPAGSDAPASGGQP